MKIRYNFSEIIFHIPGYWKWFAEINDSIPLFSPQPLPRSFESLRTINFIHFLENLLPLCETVDFFGNFIAHGQLHYIIARLARNCKFRGSKSDTTKRVEVKTYTLRKLKTNWQLNSFLHWFYFPAEIQNIPIKANFVKHKKIFIIKNLLIKSFCTKKPSLAQFINQTT